MKKLGLFALVLTLAFSALALGAAPAGAQEEPNFNDFCDDAVPRTCDLDGYVAALGAFLARGQSGTVGARGLPITGGESGLLVSIGGAFVIAGSGAVVAARRRKAVSPDIA